MNDLGKQIKDKRKELKLTQKELADLVNVSSQVISNWERGYTTPNSDDLQRLSKALNVSLDNLMGVPVYKDTNIFISHADQKNSLERINNLIKQYGIEQMGFFDIEKWKKLTPEDIKIIEEHFKMIVKIADERNKLD